MRWLLITNTSDLESKLNDCLFQQDKKNKLITINFDIENIKKQTKSVDDLAGCFIFANNAELSDINTLITIGNFTGILLNEQIQVFSNLSILKDTAVCQQKLISIVDTIDEVLKTLTKSYKKVIETSVQRIAKNSLLKKGIPFTSDCFASYIAKNKEEIINKFLEAGMGVNVRDDVGTPMLNIACRNDNFEIVEMLLDLGAELNAISEDRGYTAVMDAIWRGNEKITRFLISKGAELNTINKEGQTNLILAVGADRISLVQLLAENGADPDVKDMMGMSAYNYATLFRKEKIVEILKPYHKDV